MSHEWLNGLRLSKPALAEALHGLCCDAVCKSIKQPNAYVVSVVDGIVIDVTTLRMFWEFIGRRKTDYENRHKKKS